jgi:thiol-disulfide isomerase/thioredoxin
VLSTCLLALTGCSALQGTGDKGYVSGDGQVVQYDAADRGEPASVSGKDLDGNAVDVADNSGRPTVVVVWAAWCGPCRAEAPDVVAAARELSGVADFLGLDIRDSPTNAKSFVRTFGVPYPSLSDPEGRALLSFPVGLGPKTIPGFAVLDSQGRVAATIAGPLPSKLTLVELVKEVAAEDG